MNLVEAIKSGKRYRRRGSISVDNKTLAFDSNGNLGLDVNGGAPDWYDPDYLDYVFSMRDVLDSDWEVEEKSVTITRADFGEAWRRALDVTENMGIMTRQYLCELVVRELGL